MVKVKLFAGIRQKVGKSELEIKIKKETSLKSFLSVLRKKYPALDASHLVVAINHEFASLDKMIKNEDEIALLPPVSGG